MYTLHIANKNYSSWSLRPWVLMKVLGIPFEEELHLFGRGEDFKTFSPSGKVPCLVDGEVAVWDSLAIVEYLAERHPGVWPTDPVARAWARCAAAEMHSSFGTLRDVCSMSCGVRVKLRQITPALKRDIERFDALWVEGRRRFGGPFLAGPTFTAVDAFFAPVAFRALTYQLQLSADAMAYASRLRELPAMRSWYEAALRETARDHGHEADVLSHGSVLQDLRARA